MSEVILFFSSNAETMIATKALKDAGLPARMIPKPTHVSTSSNLCLSLDPSLETKAKSAIDGAGVAIGGVVK